MITSQSLPELVRLHANRIIESNAAALSGLYDLTATRLVRYAVSITGNQHDAEDAVQNTLVKVAARPTLLADSDQPWFYLLRMVRNECLVILRRRKRLSFLSDFSGLLNRLAVDEIERADTDRKVWSALRSLPAEQSEVVVLKIWEGLTFSEIGAVLDQSPSTIASRYRYAIAKMAARLAVVERSEISRG